MAYIGRNTDKISNIEVLDNITFDGSSSYSITKSSVAFVPNSAQSCLISIDGVVQATNFTVSTSTIDFGVAIAGTSTCDFFLHYGTGLITVPADGSVTTAKLGDGAVTTAKITDANVTSAKMFSGFKNGITEADQWRLTANFIGNVDPIASNLERNDNASFGYIGTGMSVSSGIWTFPSTGIYLVEFVATMERITNDALVTYGISGTTDNSSYSNLARNFTNTGTISASYNEIIVSSFFDVTDISTHKVKFFVASSVQETIGVSSENHTYMTFIRLGDT